MNDQVSYVRDHLAEARKKRGQIAKIARAVEIDRRTVLSVLDTEHNPSAGTLDTLAKYFKKEARKAERAGK